MNLHAVASGLVGAVNPFRPAVLLLSAGAPTTAPDGTRVPAYQTPAAFVGSIAGTILTVESTSQGQVAPGQTIDDGGVNVLPATMVVSANPDGTFTVSRAQTVSSQAMAANLVVQAQIQDLTQETVRLVEALNLQGSQKVIYVSGFLAGVVRPEQKGGDLIIADGETYLTTAVLEQWQNWCRVAATLQNGQ